MKVPSLDSMIEQEITYLKTHCIHCGKNIAEHNLREYTIYKYHTKLVLMCHGKDDTYYESS